MLALSVRQPWAEQIASGEKTREYRCWTTDYRGPLLIVSALKGSGPHPRGVTVCVVQLVRIVRHRVHGFAWVLSSPRRVPMRRVRGRLGLFEVAHKEKLHGCQAEGRRRRSQEEGQGRQEGQEGRRGRRRLAPLA